MLTLAACGGGGGDDDPPAPPVQNPPANTAPTVQAGDDQTIQFPTNSVEISGSATDAENDALTYAWTSSPAENVAFADASAASTTATFSAEGTYTLTLTVSDGTTSATDALSVVVQPEESGGGNTAPTVDAGADQSIQLPTNSVELSGAATDAESDALTYAWTSSPEGVTFADAAAAATTATFPSEGAYTLTLTVSDGSTSASDALLVTVQAADSSGVYPAPDADETVADRGWTRIAPQDVGMDATLLTQAEAYALTGPGGAPLAGSGLIVKGGQLVHSWGEIDTRFPSQSATKSIGGMALGLALDDGLLTLQTRGREILPTLGNPPDTNDPAQLDTITVLQLATHTAGFEKDRGYGDLLFQPGTTWHYSDGGLNWLADVLTTAFGADLRDVLTTRVWTNLGVNLAGPDDVQWRDNLSHTPEQNGIAYRELSSGMTINTNAMARVGLLFLRDGVWSTGRILSESFVAAVQTPPAETAAAANNDPTNFPGATTNYGVLWWTNAEGLLPDVPRDAYWAWGQGDSLIVVIPSLDLVIARIGAIATGVSAGREWGESNWNADYAVLEPFLNPIVCAADATSSACSP